MSKRQHTEEEKAKIRASKQATALRHKSQVCKVYELKVVEKRLNNLQKQQLDKIFLEAKWFYNHVLADKKNREIPLNLIKATDVKVADVLDKDGNATKHELEILPSHYKQTIVARMISNEKTIRSLVKKGLQKHGSLQFKSEIGCIPLKNMDWSFKSHNKVKIMGVKGSILVKGVNQMPSGCEFANANLVRRADGLFLKITTYIDKDKVDKETRNGKEIGLDFGVKTSITTSEGKKIDVHVEESDHLKRLQRELFRKVKGSNNRHKTIKKLQFAYQKLINKKTDMANKIVHELKAYECIVI